MKKSLKFYIVQATFFFIVQACSVIHYDNNWLDENKANLKRNYDVFKFGKDSLTTENYSKFFNKKGLGYIKLKKKRKVLLHRNCFSLSPNGTMIAIRGQTRQARKSPFRHTPTDIHVYNTDTKLLNACVSVNPRAFALDNETNLAMLKNHSEQEIIPTKLLFYNTKGQLSKSTKSEFWYGELYNQVFYTSSGQLIFIAQMNTENEKILGEYIYGILYDKSNNEILRQKLDELSFPFGITNIFYDDTNSTIKVYGYSEKEEHSYWYNTDFELIKHNKIESD